VFGVGEKVYVSEVITAVQVVVKIGVEDVKRNLNSSGIVVSITVVGL
jgi:hypothetical protein